MVFNRDTPYNNYNTTKYFEMRTQLDDLRDDLKNTRETLAYLESKGLKGNDDYKHLKLDEEWIVSTINNIR